MVFWNMGENLEEELNLVFLKFKTLDIKKFLV